MNNMYLPLRRICIPTRLKVEKHSTGYVHYHKLKITCVLIIFAYTSNNYACIQKIYYFKKTLRSGVTDYVISSSHYMT
jgi:hypothetical protein